MFRRKDEFELDETNGAQGSLLGSAANESETVNVLSPQQASQYQSSNQATNSSSPISAASTTSSASFSSPTSFGQTARPLTTPAAPVASPASSFRPANTSNAPTTSFNDAPRRPITESRASSSSSSSFSSSSAVSNLNNSAKDASRRVLTVGTEILLKGEITTCDRLVIEGKVDATVSEVHTMELAESGSFKGFAEVEFAEISGVFEGELIVKSGLVIYSSGKVRGKITYGEIEIERGGELTGEIKTVGMTSTTTSSSRKPKEDKVAA